MTTDFALIAAHRASTGAKPVVISRGLGCTTPQPADSRSCSLKPADRTAAGLAPSAAMVRMAPTSYRPSQVETRAQSWRADDKRMHVDAFPSRPNYGERILRV